MAMGQGAGTAAALVAKRNITTREIDTAELRRELVSQKQFLLNENQENIVDKGLILNRVNSDGKNAGHYNPFQK